MPDIKHAVRIAAPVTDIDRLVRSGDGFRRWWAEDVEVDADGLVRLGFFNRSTVYTLRPRSAPGDSRAMWSCESGREWTGTELLFALEPAGIDVVLRFTHANWASETDYFIQCNTTWGELMYRLKSAAVKHAVSPLFRKAGMAY
jgi:hypothetical protein